MLRVSHPLCYPEAFPLARDMLVFCINRHDISLRPPHGLELPSMLRPALLLELFHPVHCTHAFLWEHRLADMPTGWTQFCEVT